MNFICLLPTVRLAYIRDRVAFRHRAEGLSAAILIRRLDERCSTTHLGWAGNEYLILDEHRG